MSLKPWDLTHYCTTTIPLPHLGATIPGWGNPYVWERTRRDSRGAARPDTAEEGTPSDWPPGKLNLVGESL